MHSIKDQWRTPRCLFNYLNNLHFFSIDGCSNGVDSQCHFFIGDYQGDDEEIKSGQMFGDFLGDFELLSEALDRFIDEHFDLPHFFVNPPYSNPLPFVERAIELKKAGYLVVMVLPQDLSTKWGALVAKHASEILFITGSRVAFIHPKTGEAGGSPSKGTMVAFFDPRKQSVGNVGFVEWQHIEKWGQ